MKAKLITLFLAVSIVPLSTVAVLSFNTAEAELNRAIGNGLHAIAADRANNLNIINEMRVQEARRLQHPAPSSRSLRWRTRWSRASRSIWPSSRA